MPLHNPYYRIARPFPPQHQTQGDWLGCYKDARNAPDATDLIRAGKLLELELLDLFQFIEPHDDNRAVYSHKLHQILLRACVEIEANCSAVLDANGYRGAKNKWSVCDYWKIDKAVRLSDYEVSISTWRGVVGRQQPFSGWKSSHSLNWYQGYNTVKHDRSRSFPNASFENVVSAVTGVIALLFAQFSFSAFDPYRPVTSWFGDTSANTFGHHESIFTIRMPRWIDADYYYFDWHKLRADLDPFRKFAF
jgi:hypothetical protein